MEAKTGWYGQLLDIALQNYAMGEIEDCQETLRKAIDLRIAVGSRIARDRREAELVSNLEQDTYDELVDEGTRYLNYQQYEIALYYLNKARSMETATMIRSNPQLSERLQKAARPLITGMIETGRARAMGYYFVESWQMMLSSKKMMEEYGLSCDTSLIGQISALEDQLRTYQCEKFRNDYVEMLLNARNQKENGDYISAMDKVNKLIEMVLNDTLCSINDQEAWYLKALLEYPAEFMKKQEAALKMMPGDPIGFVRAYDDLYRYYISLKLAESGVAFIPLHQRVMEQTDQGFLNAMLDYYIQQKEKEHALDVLDCMWNKAHYAPSGRRQKELAVWLALEDLSRKDADPIECLNSYVPVDKSFRTFRNQYKYSWLKGSGWRVKYLSLFLKNKTGQD
jgi:hypothetical protein